MTEATGMPQIHDEAETFEDALAKFSKSLEDTRRHWAAWMMTQYPEQDVLNSVAENLRREMHASHVEVNAIYQDSQITIGAAPPKREPRVEAKDSLCVITVSVGHPIAVDDIQKDPITERHATKGLWGAWASAPIMVNGFAAGSLCALEFSHSRHWTNDDQAQLVRAARDLGNRIDEWVATH